MWFKFHKKLIKRGWLAESFCASMFFCSPTGFVYLNSKTCTRVFKRCLFYSQNWPEVGSWWGRVPACEISKINKHTDVSTAPKEQTFTRKNSAFELPCLVEISTKNRYPWDDRKYSFPEFVHDCSYSRTCGGPYRTSRNRFKPLFVFKIAFNHTTWGIRDFGKPPRQRQRKR